jgi:hypothetical protein
MEQGGPPQSFPHVRTDGAPAGPGSPPHRAPHPRGIRPVRKLPRPGTIAPGAETGAAGAQRRPARAGAPGTSRNAQRQRRTSKLRSPRRGGVHGPAVRVRGADRGGRRGHISPSRPGRAPGAAGSGAPRPTARTPVGFRTLPAERRPPEPRIPPAQVRDLLQLVHRAAPRGDIPAGGVRRAVSESPRVSRCSRGSGVVAGQSRLCGAPSCWARRRRASAPM